MSGISEALVERVSKDWLVGIGYAARVGAEIDDAGERGDDAAEVILKGRLSAALHPLIPTCRATPSKRSCAACRTRRAQP